MGWITRGISALRAPGISATRESKTAEGAEGTEVFCLLFASDFGSSTPPVGAAGSFFLELARDSELIAFLIFGFDFSDRLPPASCAASVVFIFFLSATAMLFFSQSTFEDPAGFLLL